MKSSMTLKRPIAWLIALAVTTPVTAGTVLSNTREDCLQLQVKLYEAYTEAPRIIPGQERVHYHDITASELVEKVSEIAALRCAQVPSFFREDVPEWFRKRTDAENRLYRREGESTRHQSWSRFARMWFLADEEHRTALTAACRAHGRKNSAVTSRWDAQNGRCLVKSVITHYPRYDHRGRHQIEP